MTTECQVCGLNNPEIVRKVVGGQDAAKGGYPWAALLLVDREYRKGLEHKNKLNTNLSPTFEKSEKNSALLFLSRETLMLDLFRYFYNNHVRSQSPTVTSPRVIRNSLP